MPGKMSNAPVYYALAQAQFNPVAAMSKYIDDVQDELRREGYTLFEPQQVTHLQIASPSGQSPGEPQVAHTTSWLITRPDRTSGFIISPTSITHHTTHYETSDEFIPRLLTGLKAVHSAVSLEHVSRLGLRYLDAVLPHSGETVEQYISSTLHGVSFNAARRYAMNETVFDTESGPLINNGTLIARVYRMLSPLGFPPDMLPNGLVPMSKFASRDTVSHAVIDTDHFVEGQMPVNLQQLDQQLRALHATVKLAFNATVTEHAQRIWA